MANIKQIKIGSTTYNINAYNADYAATADLLNLHTTTNLSTRRSTWNGSAPSAIKSFPWRQAFLDSSIGSDSGDLVLGLRPGAYSAGGTELCMFIDGDYYSMGKKVYSERDGVVVPGIKKATAASALGWGTNNNYVPDLSMLAYWNGAYSGTASNLAYCNKGAFGTIVTKNAGDYAAANHGHNFTSIELNSTGGLPGYGGFIDFHFNGSSSDYTSRIIENESGTLDLNGVQMDSTMGIHINGSDKGIWVPSGKTLNLGTYSGNTYSPGVVINNGGRLTAQQLTSESYKIICKPTYDGTSSYATNVYVGTSGIFSRSTNTSSRTIKNSIDELKDDSLKAEKLYSLPIHQFRYNENIITDHEDIRYNALLPGFIIEEMDEIYPIAVDKPTENAKDWSWNAQYLIPPMLKLIQDQKKEIDNYEKRISELEDLVLKLIENK